MAARGGRGRGGGAERRWGGGALLWLGKGWREWRNSCGHLLIYARAELAPFGAPRGGLGRRVWEGPPSVALGPARSDGGLHADDRRASNTARRGKGSQQGSWGQATARHVPMPQPPQSAGLPLAPGHKSLHSSRSERAHQVKTIVGVQSGQRCGRASGGKRERERQQAYKKREYIAGHPWHQTERGWTESISKEARYSFKSKVRGAGQWVCHTRPSCSSGRQHNSRGRGKTLCPAGGAQAYWG